MMSALDESMHACLHHGQMTHERLRCWLRSWLLRTACAELVAEQWTRGCGKEDMESALHRQLTPGVIKDKRSHILSLIEAKANEMQH